VAIISIGVVSDIHYASEAEQARGNDYEYRDLKNPWLRRLVRFHRRNIWLRHPLEQNHLLARFISAARAADLIVANGDFSCNSGFIGLADDAAFQSASECLGILRAEFGDRLSAIFGDHELGKIGLAGNKGEMSLRSFFRATEGLGLKPFWEKDAGRYKLIGIASSLISLPALQHDILRQEAPDWEKLREQQVRSIAETFERLETNRKVILFCHDPTALPFLLDIPPVAARTSQVELTVIGHLHSPLILWSSKLLSGMPVIGFLGHSAKKFSMALNRGKSWRPFKPTLCPSLAGIELLKDGGYLMIKLDSEGNTPVQVRRTKLSRN
jgi:predicted MPP superfamily phosphohydrolase